MAVGAMPTMGNAQAAAIQGNVLTGMATFSGAFPTIGTLAGTGFVIKHAKKLTKAAKFKL
jgi:hypothetical protein